MAGAYFIGGLVLLFAGGELVVRGAVAVADRLKVSRLLIGLVVIAFGTSSPELVLSLKAVSEAAPDLAVGTVIGSNTANVLLVLGFGALMMPVTVSRMMVLRDGTALMGATGFLLVVGAREEISSAAGILMVAALLVYVTVSYVTERIAPTPAGPAAIPEVVEERAFAMPLGLGMLALGAAGLIVGADLLVGGALDLADVLHVDERVVAISMIAVGSSLPELATILVAALRRHSDIAVGAILGSNIFNVLAVLGITAIFRPVLIDPDFYVIDYWVMAGASALLVFIMLAFRRIGRLVGAAMLLAYVAYVLLIFSVGPAAA